MSATADRIEELCAREAELQEKITERDSLDERLKAAQENREQIESDLEGQRRAAHIHGTKVAEEYVEAQQSFVSLLDGYEVLVPADAESISVPGFIEVVAKLATAKVAYKAARSTAWSLECEIPVVDELAHQAAVGSDRNYALKQILDAYAEAVATPL